MQQRPPLIGERMKTPRAAAVAGIVFSVLLTTSLILVRISVPVTSKVTQLGSRAGVVVLALNLAPFAGIAFLWFIGVVRDRLATYEFGRAIAARIMNVYAFKMAGVFYDIDCYHGHSHAHPAAMDNNPGLLPWPCCFC